MRCSSRPHGHPHAAKGVGKTGPRAPAPLAADITQPGGPTMPAGASHTHRLPPAASCDLEPDLHAATRGRPTAYLAGGPQSRTRRIVSGRLASPDDGSMATDRTEHHIEPLLV